MNDHEAKQAARKARLEARAARLEAEAQATLKRGYDMASTIPFGQPILVGHHSEKRDRRYRERIGKTFDRALEQHKAAEEVARRAASVGTGGISSDDPDAAAKLRQELAQVEDAGRQMVETNAAWRKAGRPRPDDDVGWTKVADLLGRSPNDFVKFRQNLARSRALMPYLDGRPFESYAISNNGANARRIKARIAQLERRAAVAEREPEVEREVGGVRVVEDRAGNRLRIYFPDKPSPEVRANLKRNGFRWSPSEGAWQRQLTAQARHAAEWVLAPFANGNEAP